MYVKVVNYTNPKFVYFPELILNTGLKILHISLRKGSHEYRQRAIVWFSQDILPLGGVSEFSARLRD